MGWPAFRRCFARNSSSSTAPCLWSSSEPAEADARFSKLIVQPHAFDEGAHQWHRLNRRRLHRRAAVMSRTFSTLALWLLLAVPASAQTRRPNIVIIVADDVG